MMAAPETPRAILPHPPRLLVEDTLDEFQIANILRSMIEYLWAFYRILEEEGALNFLLEDVQQGEIDTSTAQAAIDDHKADLANPHVVIADQVAFTPGGTVSSTDVQAAIAEVAAEALAGAGASTDEALVRFDGASGSLIQNSVVILDDTGNLSGLANITLSGTVDGRDVSGDGTKLDGIEAGADVTDATNVDAAGAVMETDYDAQTILLAVADDTPLPITIGASNFVGRKAAGDAGVMSKAEALAVLNVEDGADVTDATNVAAAGAVMDSDISEAEGLLRKTGAGAYEAIKTNLAASVNPTVNEDSGDGYAIGSLWINITADQVWMATDVTVAAANWEELALAAGADVLVRVSADDTTPGDLEAKVVAGAGITLTTLSPAGDEDLEISIGSDAITLDMIVDMATDSFLGRDTAATGTVEVLTPAAARAILNVADGANAYSHPNHTGDVTSVGDGAQTIAAGAVTYAKIQNVSATDRFLGRDTAGAGVVEEIDAAAARTILNVENGAAADMTDGEIKTAYEANADTNEFSDSEQTKLAGIETAADVTDATNVAAAGAIMDSDISEAEGFLRKTGAGAYEGIKSNLAAAVDPGPTDDSASGYAIGSLWINTTADTSWLCVDATAAAAVWLETSVGSGGSVDSFETRTGAVVSAAGDYTLAEITATYGDGLSRSSDTINVDLDGSTLAKGVSGLKVSDLGVDTGQLAASAVTYAKIQNISATDRFLGRDTAGAGVVEEIDAGAARTILNVADGANAYVHPNHSGDVTSVADGAQTIVANAVTLAKMADMATASFIGRDTAASGDPEILSATTARSILNVENGAAADMSDAEIKTAYEANADTNEFSDAEQTKLAGLEPDKIAELNTSIEVIDTGTDGHAVVTVDGVVNTTFDDDTMTFSFGTQDYEWGTRSSVVLTLKGKSAATSVDFELSAADKDGTDFVEIALFGLGEGGDANTERVTFRYNPSDVEFGMLSTASGSGTVRPLVFETGANDNQLSLNIDGTVTFATQSSFEAIASLQSSVTGDGTNRTMLFATESYDRGSDFSSPTFTARRTGLYDASGVCDLTGVASGHILNLQLITTGRSYKVAFENIGALQSSGAFRRTWSLTGIPMTATNTAHLELTVSGGSKDINIATDSTFAMALAA